MEALHANYTWDLVSCPSNAFVKLRLNGEIYWYKTRLVTQEYKQVYGIDYEETFPLVVKMTTVWLIFASSNIKHRSIFQMDIRNAFLHDTVKEVVYMAHPPWYISNSSLICLLERSLYDLKQALCLILQVCHAINDVWFSKSKYDYSLSFLAFSQRYDSSLVICWWYYYYWRQWSGCKSVKVSLS